MQIKRSGQSVQRQRREPEKTFPSPSTFLSVVLGCVFFWKAGSKSGNMQGEEEEVS